MKIRQLKISALSLFLLFFLLILLTLIACSSPNLIARSETSEYCKSCHVMEAEYEAWMHSGAHRRKMCVDCHLPNENRAVHYWQKSLDGLKDLVVFHSGRIPDPIKLSSHGEEVLQNNCIRCHETTVMMIDTGRKCWNCHRRITHLHTGIMETM